MKDYTLRKEWPLTDEQNEVIDFMIHRNKCVNAAQTGFGKTYATLTAATWLLLKYSDLEVVALIPQKAVKAFKRELEEKLKVKYNIISSQDTREQDGARIHLITQTMLKDNMEYITELAKNHRILLIVDEAHILEDNKSKFYNYVANIRPLAQVVWALTATPLKNDIEGLYWLMYLLDPQIVGDWWRFRNTYCILEKHTTYRMYGKGKVKQKKRVEVTEIVGYKNLDRLHKILDDYIIIKQKPYNLEYYYHKTGLNGKEQEHYLEAGKGLLRETAKDSFAVRMHDLQMVVDNINEKYKVTDKLSSKEQLFLSLIKKKMELKQPSIVYCDYNDVIDRLEKLLVISKKQTGIKQILKVTGDIPLKERTKVEELIDTNTVVLITSAGSESVNLQKANSIIFYDIPFSIKTYIQCFTDDSYILTDNGYEQIKDLEDTFNVIIHNKIYQAKKLETKISVDLYRVYFSNGRVIKVTNNHKFKVLTEKGPIWKELKDITESDSVIIETDNIVDSNQKSGIDSNIWYIIGHLVGDGFISDRIRTDRNNKRETSIVHIFGNDKYSLEVLNRVKGAYDSLGWSYTERTNTPNKNAKVYNPVHYISCYDSNIADLILNLGYPNVKATEKYIPKRIFTESLENKKAFILGLYDSDGSKIKQVSWNMSSYRLVYELQLLLASCGVNSNLYITKTQNKSYRLHIPGAYNREDLFTQERKLCRIPNFELNKILNLVHYKESYPKGFTDYIKQLKKGRGKKSKYESLFREYFLIPSYIKQEELYSYYINIWAKKPQYIISALYNFNKNIGTMEMLEKVKQYFNLDYESYYYDTVNLVNKEQILDENICIIQVDSNEHYYIGDMFPSHNCIGRVTRIDSKYDKQYIHHLEVSGTIDSYKRCLIQINGGLIESMFGKIETLPLEVGQVDRNVTYLLKQGLLWCFKQGRLLTEQELEQILKQSKVN